MPFEANKRVTLDAAAMGLATLDGWLKVQSVAAGDASTPVAQTAAVNISMGTNR